MEFTEKIFLLYVGLALLNGIVIWLYKVGIKNIKQSLATYDFHAGYLIENSPVIKERREVFKGWRKFTIWLVLYMSGVGILLSWLSGDSSVLKFIQGVIAFGTVGWIPGTVLGFLHMASLLLESKNRLLSDIIPKDRLTLITMSKKIVTSQVYEWAVKDEKMVKKLIEANPIIDELLRLNELRKAIDGKADTEARRKTLSELETLIDSLNAELMPYVDIVYLAVDANNPLNEAASAFDEVAKEIALAKSKVQTN